MVCPECGGKTEVTHNRSYPEYIRRRRVCKQCGHVMTTYETFKPPDERYPMGKPRGKTKKQVIVCRYNCAIACDGDKDCSNCGWKPKGDNYENQSET